MKTMFSFFSMLIIVFTVNTSFLFAQENMRIAVLDLVAQGVNQRTAQTVSDLLRTELVNIGKFTVVERGQMENILKEQGFQRTGCTDQECAVQLGKLMSARKILVGSVSPLGTSIILNVRIVDVEKGVVDFAAKEKADSEAELDTAVELVARKLADKIGITVMERSPFPPRNVKASDGEFTDKVVITWNAAEEAQYYYVYRSETAKGEYREVEDTKETTFSDKKVMPGIIYFYRIKSRSKDLYSDFSTTDSGYAKKEITEVKKEPEIKKVSTPSKYPLVATFSPVLLVPIGNFSDVVGSGVGGFAGVSIENVFFNGFGPGLSVGYLRLTGANDSVDHSSMVPVLATVCHSLPLRGPINLVPEISAGGLYSSVKYINKNNETATKSAFEPLFMAGLSIEYSFTNSNALQAGANYGMIYESSGIMSFVIVKASVLLRFL